MQSIKPNYIILIILVLVVQTKIFAQDTILIPLSPQYHLLEEKGIGFMPLLACNNSNQIYFEDSSYHITFPNNFFVKDTALAFNYFEGWKNAKIENRTAFLFGNYTNHQPILYVDYNHNLDFSDDGLPIKFGNDSTAIVYLSNSEHRDALLPIKLYYPRLSIQQKEKYEMVFLTMVEHLKKNDIVSIDYWLVDKKMNYKITNSWLEGESIKIGLYDANSNGLFNDTGKDRILIGNYDKNYISRKLDEGAVILTDTAQIKLGKKVYAIVEIEPTGRFIKLKESDRTFAEPLDLGDNISDLQIKLISGETRTIKDLQEKNKYLLLDFWGSWCKGCLLGLPDLKDLSEAQKDKLQIIGLNKGDNLKKIDNYISANNIQWINGYADDNVMKKLRVDDFPRYVLLDENGKIIILNGKLNDIKQAILLH